MNKSHANWCALLHSLKISLSIPSGNVILIFIHPDLMKVSDFFWFCIWNILFLATAPMAALTFPIGVTPPTYQSSFLSSLWEVTAPQSLSQILSRRTMMTLSTNYTTYTIHHLHLKLVYAPKPAPAEGQSQSKPILQYSLQYYWRCTSKSTFSFQNLEIVLNERYAANSVLLNVYSTNKAHENWDQQPILWNFLLLVPQ